MPLISKPYLTVLPSLVLYPPRSLTFLEASNPYSFTMTIMIPLLHIKYRYKTSLFHFRLLSLRRKEAKLL